MKSKFTSAGFTTILISTSNVAGSNKKHIGYVLIKALGIAALMFLILVSITGAIPFAYITNYGDGDAVYESDTVSVIDTATNTFITNVDVGRSPSSIVITPDGSKIYVANRDNDRYGYGIVSVIDTATNKVTDTVDVGGEPNSLAITPDGSKVYVAGGRDNDDNMVVSVIDTDKNKVTDTIDVENCEFLGDIAVTPDGTRVYVVDMAGPTFVIDTATNEVTAMVPLGKYTDGIAVTPDGTKVYVANGFSNVSTIDTATNKVTATVNIGTQHPGIAIGNKKVQNASHTVPCGFNSLLFVMFILYIWKKPT